MRKRGILLAIAAGLVLLGGLAVFAQVRALSYGELVARLRASGVTVIESGNTEQDQALSPALLSGTKRILSVNGERVETYEYATALFAGADAARISPDGSMFRTGFGPLGGAATVVDWVAPPHFYTSGRLIVQYIGTHQDVTAALASALGPQIAGGTA